jgi:hypothetical protein
MRKQIIGNAIAGLLFLIVAIWDFAHDTTGIGTVFLIFAAVYLGLALMGKNRRSPDHG